MKLFTKSLIAVSGVIIAFTSLRRYLNGTGIWRLRKTRLLERQLRKMLRDRPEDQIEMLINTCQVEHLDLYTNWVGRDHDVNHEPDKFYTVVVPIFIEYERLRQVYDLSAKQFLAIGSYRRYGHCHVMATMFAEKIDHACDVARHDGYPLDRLLQSVR